MRRRLVLGAIAMVVGTALVAVRPGRGARHRRHLDRRGRGDLGRHDRRARPGDRLSPCSWCAGRVFGAVFRTPGRLAGENALRNPRRTGATASALMIGLAVVSAVGVLAASLSATQDAIVDDQFTQRLPRPDADVRRLQPRVRQPDGGRRRRRASSRGSRAPRSACEVDGKPDQTFAAGVDPAFFEIYDLTMVDGTDQISGDQTVLSEGRAVDLRAGVGDTIEVEFPGGKKVSLEVGGHLRGHPRRPAASRSRCRCSVRPGSSAATPR